MAMGMMTVSVMVVLFNARGIAFSCYAYPTSTVFEKANFEEEVSRVT